MSTTRRESFSDGVLAVATTLLVLNIEVPSPGTGHLAHQLANRWPQYVAYATSFLTIGIIWANHHAMIGRLRMTDHSILMLNLLLLLTIGLIPFATALLADSLRQARARISPPASTAACSWRWGSHSPRSTGTSCSARRTCWRRSCPRKDGG